MFHTPLFQCRRTSPLGLVLAFVVLCAASVAHGSPPHSILRDTTDQRAIDAMIEAGEYDRAEARIEAVLESRANDFQAIYGRARIRAGTGETEAVLDQLLEAVRFGFVDFHRIDHDPLFERFRGTEDYRRFVLAWATLLDERGRVEYETARERFADGYIHRRDETLRLNIIAAADAESLDDALDDLDRIARFVEGELFPIEAKDPRRPHPWVTMIVCTQEDFYQLLPIIGVGGIYDPDQKRLISRDLGPSLRHEFVHALHWRHMEAIGQVHPLWFQEALATLLEDLAPAGVANDANDPIVQPSWRTNIARRLARSASMTPWPRLFTLADETFTGRNPRANYAQVRTIADYLHSHGKLGAYYRTLVEGFEEDPSGLAAFEAVFDRPTPDIERAFRVWTRELEEVAVVSWPGDAVLPFRVRPGPVDGMRVDQAVRASLITPMDPEDLRTRRLVRGDVILAVEGAPVPTTDDFVRALGGGKPGDRIGLLIRRGESRFEVRVRLVERNEFEDPW